MKSKLLIGLRNCSSKNSVKYFQIYAIGTGYLRQPLSITWYLNFIMVLGNIGFRIQYLSTACLETVHLRSWCAKCLILGYLTILPHLTTALRNN